MSAVEIVLDDINQRRLVSTNRRIHHMVRAEVCAYWRGLAFAAARNAYGMADEGCYWHNRVRIEVWYRFPDRRRRETSNLYSYVAKPLVDGLVDARVIKDDDDFTVIGPDARRDPERGPHRIVIRIEDLP